MLPRGKPWTVNEERSLKELLDLGYSLSEIAARMGKTDESVRQKVHRLGLKVGGASKSGLGSNESLLQGLPTMLEVMKELWEATQAYKKPDLSRLEVQRLHGRIQGLIAYKEMFEDFAKFRRGEKQLVELRRDLGEVIEKGKNPHSKKGSAGAQT